MRRRVEGFVGPRLLVLAVGWCLLAVLLAWWLPLGVTVLLCAVGIGLLVRWTDTR